MRDMTDSIDEPAPADVLPHGLVSVVIPCFNHAHFVAQAIASVLAQSHPNFEIIVVDDGSTDNTAEVVRNYSSVRYIYQENAGRSAARNTGLRQSVGEFLVFLDADDRLLPNALAVGIGCMREHPECALVSGHCRIIDGNGVILPSPRQLQVERDHYLQLLRGGTYIWCPAVALFQRKVFDFAHGFDPAMVPVEDYDLYLRVTRDFPVHCHAQVIAEYRQHSSNTSRDVATMANAALVAHRAQWDFAKANSRYRQAYEIGRWFWQNDYPFQQMITRIREIVRERLPADAVVAVASSGKSELLRLDGRRAWHFPQIETPGAGDLFAEAAEGSLPTDPWIEPGMTYTFSLRGGPEFSKVLARVLVRGVANLASAASAEPIRQEPPRGDGVLLTANPNPVPAGEKPGATTLTWKTGDGSVGRVYVLSVGKYIGRDPISSEEAREYVEAACAHGADYLLLPAKSFYWLDRFEKFRAYVERTYAEIVRDKDTCAIFDLRHTVTTDMPTLPA
jgi:glycosyltransferase involved in cell wall biosynthesis